jgi:hypothetical protein
MEENQKKYRKERRRTLRGGEVGREGKWNGEMEGYRSECVEKMDLKDIESKIAVSVSSQYVMICIRKAIEPTLPPVGDKANHRFYSICTRRAFCTVSHPCDSRVF